MRDYEPSIRDLSADQEAILLARLRAVRQAICHGGEKGRALEIEVQLLLREILPSEYGISTGFIAWCDEGGSNRLTPQLDLIIYDALRCAPLITLASCAVFPLEAVYACVEVKTSIRSSRARSDRLPANSIEHCLSVARDRRRHTTRRYMMPDPESRTGTIHRECPWNPIRMYIFAFGAGGTVAKDTRKLAVRISQACHNLGKPVHLHGLFIVGQAFLRTRSVDDSQNPMPQDYFHVEYDVERPLSALKWSLRQALARFPRFPKDWTPDLQLYGDVPAFEVAHFDLGQ